jgi:uncharacterized membrane protein YdjX (TVP38/TMEM64 family)
MIHLPRWLRALVVAALCAAIAYGAIHRDALHVAWLTDIVDDHPRIAPMVFVALHVGSSLAFLPRGVMALAAGSFFGVGWGLLWAVIGSMAGAMAGFAIARFTNRGALRAEQAPLIGGLLRRAEGGGWRLVLATRLIPVLPHSLVNYVYGMSRLSGRDFAIGSFLGMLPQTIAFVQLGEAGASAASGEHFVGPLLWGGGLFLLSIVGPRFLPRRWRG